MEKILKNWPIIVGIATILISIGMSKSDSIHLSERVDKVEYDQNQILQNQVEIKVMIGRIDERTRREYE